MFRDPRASLLSLGVSLALVSLSCSSARQSAPSRAEELAEFVLIIKAMPDGQVSHTWQRAAEFKLSQHGQSLGAYKQSARITLASHGPRDCDQEQIDCYRSCMRRRLPAHLNHIKRGSGAHGSYCANKCLREYMDCLELQKSRALEFPIINDAVDWLKRHREELLVGSIVVIAGVAFVALSGGAGLLILAPVALVAS